MTFAPPGGSLRNSGSIRRRSPRKCIGALVIRALDQHKESLQSGALVVIDPEDFRARILPI
jgi:hypothetical protein